MEIGGHNYWCFEPQILHRVWKKMTGDYGGPRVLQKLDTEMTIKVINQELGRQVRSWRNHMYMHGPHIDQVLLEAGVEICSDGVERACVAPRMHSSGLWHMPINVIPDHEHRHPGEALGSELEYLGEDSTLGRGIAHACAHFLESGEGVRRERTRRRTRRRATAPARAGNQDVA